MKMIEVYQCELDKTIPLKYIGKVLYIGETKIKLCESILDNIDNL